eukprot:339991-Rhodomonas_salina.3
MRAHSLSPSLPCTLLLIALFTSQSSSSLLSEENGAAPAVPSPALSSLCPHSYSLPPALPSRLRCSIAQSISWSVQDARSHTAC